MGCIYDVPADTVKGMVLLPFSLSQRHVVPASFPPEPYLSLSAVSSWLGS